MLKGVVLAARTIGALCMRAESISPALHARRLMRLAFDDIRCPGMICCYSVAQSWDLRVRLCDREAADIATPAEIAPRSSFVVWYTETGEERDKKGI